MGRTGKCCGIQLGELDEYHPHNGNIEVWRGYLLWLRGSGNPELVGPLYERALITNCDNETLWEEYFLVLENESNFARALYILRSHSTFFRSLSKELTYYWVELEERDSHTRSREIYLQLESTERNPCSPQPASRCSSGTSRWRSATRSS